MNEAYADHSPRIEERDMYRVLEQPEVQAKMKKVNYVLDTLFADARPSLGITNTYSHYPDYAHRNLHYAYTTETQDDDELLYDTENHSLFKYMHPVYPVFNEVIVEHYVYHRGLLEEEYTARVDRNLYGTIGDFTNRYHFQKYRGGAWQTWVEHNRIYISTQEEGSNLYGREMTAYDFEEFYKDAAQMDAQLNALLVQ